MEDKRKRQPTKRKDPNEEEETKRDDGKRLRGVITGCLNCFRTGSETSETDEQQEQQQDSSVYDISGGNCRAIIINNKDFSAVKGMENRKGSQEDAEALKLMFKSLGFHPVIHDNLSAEKMMEVLKKEADYYKEKEADCLAVVILSHGELVPAATPAKMWQRRHRDTDQKASKLEQCIVGVDGEYAPTAKVVALFQDDLCPKLQGKPRLFFIQACRGEKYDDGVNVFVTGGKSDDDPEKPGDLPPNSTDQEGQLKEVPIFMDFLVMFATPPNHFAWRRRTGSWFIQSLCEVLKSDEVIRLSLIQALTRVSKMVALGWESDHEKFKGKKQVPVIQHMLTKDIFLRKK